MFHQRPLRLLQEIESYFIRLHQMAINIISTLRSCDLGRYLLFNSKILEWLN